VLGRCESVRSEIRYRADRQSCQRLRRRQGFEVETKLDYLTIAAAKECKELRLVLTVGVPGPWGEAAKGLFHVKGIAYVPVAQAGGGENAELQAWLGRDNAPIVVAGDEPPRSGWSEILLFAEARTASPRLIPADPFDRALMFGLCHEICGEDGFAWNRRLMLLDQVLATPTLADSPVAEPVRRLGRKYGYSPATAAAAPVRVASVLAMLSARLRSQRDRGSRFFVGDSLTALDIYWATFAAMLEPLPEAQCPMPEFLRAQYALADGAVRAAADPILLEHRDAVYRGHLELPLDF
jgi:glutathione S-transferase